MNTTWINKGLVLLLLVVALTACSSAATETAAPVEESTAPAATEVSADAVEEGTPETTVNTEGCLGSADTAVVDLDCREIKIAVENAYLPFNYISIETGEPGGWDYEAWTEVCTRLHCTPTFVETTWDSLILGVSEGQFDAAANGVSVTEDRKEMVDFSNGYIKIQQRLIVRKGDTRFASIEEFAADPDLLIGAQVGTTNYETAAKYVSEDRISAFEQMPFAVQALIAGDVDAVIMDEVAGLGYQGENADKIEVVGPSITSEDLGFIFTKGSDLTEPVNQALQAMIDDGTLTTLNEKFFGSAFDVTYDDIQE